MIDTTMPALTPAEVRKMTLTLARYVHSLEGGMVAAGMWQHVDHVLAAEAALCLRALVNVERGNA